MPNRQPKLRRVSDGGITIHLHDYHINAPGHRLIPLCRPRAWNTKRWVDDDGVGADDCERCWEFHRSRQEKRAEAVREKNRRNRKREANKERARQYREANKELLSRKRRLRNRAKRNIA